MEVNPYESPRTESAPPRRPRIFITRRIVFWSGVASMVIAQAISYGNYALFGDASSDDDFYVVHATVEIFAIVAFLLGFVAFIGSWWLSNFRGNTSRK